MNVWVAAAKQSRWEEEWAITRTKAQADVGKLAVCDTFLTLFAVISRLAGAGAVPGAALQRVLLHTLTLLRAARAEGPPGTACSQKKRKHQLCNYAGAGWNCTLLQNATAAGSKTPVSFPASTSPLPRQRCFTCGWVKEEFTWFLC